MKAIIALCGLAGLWVLSWYVEAVWQPVDRLAYHTAVDEVLAHRWRFVA